MPTILKKDLLIGMPRHGDHSDWQLYVQVINEPPSFIHSHSNLVLVLLRLWLIRNRNQKFIFSTLILFVFAHVATITCVVTVLINVNRKHTFFALCEQEQHKLTLPIVCTASLMFDHELSMCVMMRRSILGLLYVPAVSVSPALTIHLNAMSLFSNRSFSMVLRWQ